MLLDTSGSYAYGMRCSVLLTAGPQSWLRPRGGFQDRTGEVSPLNMGELYAMLQRLERDGLAGSDGTAAPSAALLADVSGWRMPDASAEPQAGASPERPADRRTAHRSLSRWAVHLGLLCSAAAALGTLQLLHVRIAIHTDVGLVFVGLVVVHLAQRRQTLARMASQIVRVRTFAGRRIRLTVSDFLLLFITLNVLVSGVLDWDRGEPIQLPLPRPFNRWHLDSGLVLVVYLTVHVWRRRKRLRRSTIR